MSIITLPKSLIESSKYLLESSLYESLLLEDRIQFLKDRNPEIDSSHDTLAQHRLASDIIDHFSNNADPSKNKQHTQWILGQYKKKQVRQEDTPRIHEVLSNFDKYKSKLDKKDINQYKTISDVSDAVRPHIGTAATKSEAKQESIVKGRTLVHDNGKGLKVYRLEKTPEGKQASQEIYGGGHEAGGTHTSWCTAARSEQCMFDHYSKDEPLHVIHTPSGNVYQAHVKSDQLMDAKDNEFNLERHKSDIKYVSDALDHIPNGWKMKLDRNLPMNKEHLDKALNDENEDVRKAAARNPNATKEHLDKALNDKEWSVRRLAAIHPNATKEHLDKAINDEDEDVRKAAAGHPNATKEHLDKAINDPEYNVRSRAAEHPKATKENIDKALNDNHWHVRMVAAGHPNATKENIDKALSDNNEYVRSVAAGHPNATKENLVKAIDDEDWTVIEAAKNNPRAKEYGLV